MVACALNVGGGKLAFDAQGKPLAPDFLARFVAGRMVLDGQVAALYDLTAQKKYQDAIVPGAANGDFLDVYLSPPFVAYLYAPLAALPYVAAVAVFTLVGLTAMLGALCLMWPLLPALHGFGFRWFALAAFSVQPVMDLVGSGQDAGLALLLLVIVLRLLLAQRDRLAGALLGLGLFKPQLFILIPPLLALQRRWRALGWAVAVGGALAAWSVAAVGWAGLAAYARLLTSQVYQQQIASGWSWKMTSLPAFVRTLAPGLPPLSGAIVAGGVLAGVLILLAALGRRGPGDQHRFATVFALAVLGTVLGSPHVFVYDGVVLLIPAALLIEAAPADRRLRAVLVVVYLLFWTTPLRQLASLALNPRLGLARVLLTAPWTAPALALLFGIGWVVARNRGAGAPSEPGAGTSSDRPAAPVPPTTATAGPSAGHTSCTLAPGG